MIKCRGMGCSDDKQRDRQFLDISGQLGRIRDHVRSITDGGQVEQGSPIWMSLEKFLMRFEEG